MFTLTIIEDNNLSKRYNVNLSIDIKKKYKYRDLVVDSEVSKITLEDIFKVFEINDAYVTINSCGYYFITDIDYREDLDEYLNLLKGRHVSESNDFFMRNINNKFNKLEYDITSKNYFVHNWIELSWSINLNINSIRHQELAKRITWFCSCEVRKTISLENNLLVQICKNNMDPHIDYFLNNIDVVNPNLKQLSYEYIVKNSKALFKISKRFTSDSITSFIINNCYRKNFYTILLCIINNVWKKNFFKKTWLFRTYLDRIRDNNNYYYLNYLLTEKIKIEEDKIVDIVDKSQKNKNEWKSNFSLMVSLSQVDDKLISSRYLLSCKEQFVKHKC